MGLFSKSSTMTDYKQESFYSVRLKFTFANAIHLPSEIHFQERTPDTDGKITFRVRYRVYADMASLTEKGSPIDEYYMEKKLTETEVNNFKNHINLAAGNKINDYMP
jgi:hypothetical protein